MSIATDQTPIISSRLQCEREQQQYRAVSHTHTDTHSRIGLTSWQYRAVWYRVSRSVAGKKQKSYVFCGSVQNKPHKRQIMHAVAATRPDNTENVYKWSRVGRRGMQCQPLHCSKYIRAWSLARPSCGAFVNVRHKRYIHDTKGLIDLSSNGRMSGIGAASNRPCTYGIVLDEVRGPHNGANDRPGVRARESCSRILRVYVSDTMPAMPVERTWIYWE